MGLGSAVRVGLSIGEYWASTPREINAVVRGHEGQQAQARTLQDQLNERAAQNLAEIKSRRRGRL